MTPLSYTTGSAEEDLILRLWNSFRPGEKQSEAFADVKEKLQKDFGYIIDAVWPSSFSRDPSKEFHHLFENKEILPKKEAERAINVLVHASQNVNFPLESESSIPFRDFNIDMSYEDRFGRIGMRLARPIEDRFIYAKKRGIELIIFDKGPGIRTIDDGCGLLELCDEYFKPIDPKQLKKLKPNDYHQNPGGERIGLSICLQNSDYFEIETLGKRWNKQKHKQLIDVPVVNGLKVKAKIYGVVTYGYFPK